MMYHCYTAQGEYQLCKVMSQSQSETAGSFEF